MGEFGALTREFYIAKIGTWENYGGKRVWRFIGGRYNEVLLYIKITFNPKFSVFKVCCGSQFSFVINALHFSSGFNINLGSGEGGQQTCGWTL